MHVLRLLPERSCRDFFFISFLPRLLLFLSPLPRITQLSDFFPPPPLRFSLAFPPPLISPAPPPSPDPPTPIFLLRRNPRKRLRLSLPAASSALTTGCSPPAAGTATSRSLSTAGTGRCATRTTRTAKSVSSFPHKCRNNNKNDFWNRPRRDCSPSCSVRGR